MQIRGKTVLLHEQTVTGKDPFGKNITSESLVEVENVLLEPADYSAIVDELNITGKRLAFILHIPKGDTHNWEDTKVDFYGKTFKTFGPVMEYQEELTPLDWNKRVKVEKFD